MQRGTLFTEDFLREGIRETDDWKNLAKAELEAIEQRLKGIFAPFEVGVAHNEADTEERVIYKVFDALGWEGLIRRRITMAPKGHEDIPDGLLLPDSTAGAQADKTKKPADKFRHGVVICESKRWELGLDSGRGDQVPSTQMLRYLTRADVMSDGRILWGILTNGRIWRLYSQRAKSRSEQFVEFDLGALLAIGGYAPDIFSPRGEEARHLLKAFVLMFRREAFLPTRDKGRTFHDVALEEGRLWEAKVAKDLSNLVFEDVFPGFVRAIAKESSRSSMDEVRTAALTLLYRLLFVLYAEDRDLLPKRDKRYEDYGVFKTVRVAAAKQIDDGATFSAKAAHYWDHLRTLFGLIDGGDRDIGLPPYNGGLFDGRAHPLLDRIEIPDAIIVPLLDKLSRTQADKKLINYRDLSVQQLGSIYERLLEYEPVQSGGEIDIRLNPFARKGSGSYYTPDELVGLIIEQTVGPLAEEQRKAFRAQANRLKSVKTPAAERLKELASHDYATALLDLKVCDPAMGSGHFLVRLVDYLADAVIEALADAPKEVTWGEYSSPLAERIAAIRARILAEAKANKWSVREDQLEDRMIVRRMVLKRAVYGVDKNPMAVELAQVSLWLHTFTVGAPLSFLDHHLRCGDSLFGEWVVKTERELSEAAGMFVHNEVVAAKQAARLMLDIEAAADADLAEARRSAEAFSGVREATDPLIALLSFWHACRWMTAGKEQKQAKDELLKGAFGDPIALLTGRAQIKIGNSGDGEQRSKGEKRGEELKRAAAELLAAATKLVREERFLHWEVAFPGVWADWESNDPKGGFDAVIGNPPWDRLKMQEVEWFAARRPEIALAQRAADRKRMIEALRKAGDPLYGQYETAVAHADMALERARDGGEYPLLGRGDVNIYSLFVERAQRLIKPDGVAGLLVPSGIASDKGAADFFRSIATTARLVALLDFENRGREDQDFFPDVDSRFKFCAFVASGPKRSSVMAKCGFFLNGEADLDNPERVFPLTPDDFALVNPNTGTAPIFRTHRDAGITTAIYKRLPVLVKRDEEGEVSESTWPVRYLRMFDMTNDSSQFWTRERLEKHGAYPIAGSRWQKGKQVFVPLYVGRMINQFDHRAASVGINPENIHVAGYSEQTSEAEHQQFDYGPTPQYWLDLSAVEWPSSLGWCFGFRDIARSTDVRTAIGTIVPKGAYGNTVPLIMSDQIELALLAGNLSSIALDYVARQKVQSTHLNWYIVEQLPVIPAKDYAGKFGTRKAADIIRDHVLRLSYTANDLADFARDMGHVDKKTGDVLPPFRWNEEERAHLRARLDALYFLLYGIRDRDDVRYILGTFPIVREQDEKAFGRYRTADLILAYMNALEAGDTTTVVAL